MASLPPPHTLLLVVVRWNPFDQIIQYADEVILFGKENKTHTLPVLISSKFPVHHFTKMADLIEYLTQDLPAQAGLPNNSHILVKGSQNTIFLERAVESILANPTDAQHLCRRGKFWDGKRTQLD